MGRKPLIEDRLGMLRDVFPASVWRTFELMRVAEEEIAGRQRVCMAEDRDRLNRAFALMYPTHALRNKTERLYRQHCRELMDRVLARQDTTLGTKAEVLAALSDTSLLAPPGQQHAALMERLCDELGYPVEGEKLREPWPHASEEMLAQARRACAVGTRTLAI